MQIEITASNAEAFQAFFDEHDRGDIASTIAGKISWLHRDNTASISVPFPSLPLLEALREFSKQHGLRGLALMLTSLINMLNSPDTAKVGKLQALPLALESYLLTDAIDGWLYKDNGHFNVPYLVTGIEYKKAETTGNNKRPAFVVIQLLANAASTGKHANGSKRTSIVFDSDDIGGQTIPSLLLSQGFTHETEELKAEYLANNELFKDYYAREYQQFLVNGLAFSVDHYDSIGKPLTQGGGVFKAINDEPAISRTFFDEIQNTYWEERDNVDFSRVPFHPFIYLYMLETHEYSWAHVTNMTPYVYRPELKSKLILPDDHKDLIDILTSDLSLLEDLVDGKTGGTTIMCSGRPGTGKTLTAEIYSEVIGKPLYRVHSGLLGTTSSEVEKNLKIILGRAQRWQCCLLIDECDTWVRERGNDIEQNAIVASFLRTLEYYSGLLFLTTNRSSDIDDAILSRCIAHISYLPPNEVQRQLLWQTLSENYNANLSEETIKAAVVKWQEIVGRDIKELLKLSIKFASRSKGPIDMEVLTRCAQFRGL